MKFTIVLFEISRRMRKPMTYITFVVFLLFGFIGMWRASMGCGLMTRITTAGHGNIEADAPFALFYYITLLSTFGLLIAMAWFGNAASRDFRHKAYHLFYYYPIGKFSYLVGRFSGAFIGMLFVVSGVAIGGLGAAMSPLADQSGIGSLNVIAFLQPYAIAVIPNLFLAGTLFFSITLLSRQFTAVWTGLAAIVVLHLIALGLASADAKLLAALLDPSGLVATGQIYGYWSIAEKNQLLIPLSGALLANRLVWMGIATAICIATYHRFSFQIPEVSALGDAKVSSPRNLGLGFRRTGISSAPRRPRNFSFGAHLQRMLHLAGDDFGYLTRRRSFYFMVALGLGLVLVTGYNNIGLVRGTQTFPVTSQVLDALCGNLYFLGVLIALYCSSALVCRQREAHVHEILDVLPVPRWVPLIGKIGAMTLVQALMMTLVMIGGIVIQIDGGYFDFEAGLYLTELLGVQLVFYVLVSVFALFVQILTGKKLLGFIVTLFFIDEFMVIIGLDHHLWTFASRPSHVYSDMNGYGPFASSITAYNLYWISLSVILVVLSMVLYPRGLDTGLKQRLRGMKGRLSRSGMIAAAAGALGCLVVGGFIVYNTVFLNRFETQKAAIRHMVEYEKTYKSWANRPQPHVTGMEVQVDLFPADRRVETRGRIQLVNEASSAIDTLFIQTPTDAHILDMHFGPSATQILVDHTHGVYLFELNDPMQPGDTKNLHFELELVERGFEDVSVNTRLVENGIFLTVVHLFPASGYDPYITRELSDNDQREKHGLPAVPRMKSADDMAARMHTPLGAHSDWIDFDAVVSTSADQIAVAPGKLVKEWNEDGRRFYHYRTSTKILCYAAVLSARYAVQRDRWNNVDIEIYHHPKHSYNTDLIMRSVKESLNYFTREFSPYQFPVVRIVEFPRYEIFAEAFPGLIPLSEGYGFIAKYDDDKVKEAYRVIAHEMGHQWWAHQVIGGNVEGFFVLSEVMAQYSALMVSRGQYDRQQIDTYVRNEIDRYLRGRGREVEEEVPLVRSNQNTWYQHYAKGFVVMNALIEYIGEDRINDAIRAFIDKTAFQKPPFTTSSELVDHFKSVTPDSLLYLVEDCFDRIVLFDNEALAANCERGDDGRYQVTLSFEARKWNVDGSGAETSALLRELIEFAVFDGNGAELCRQRRWVDDDMDEITMSVDQIPARAGIDPHYLLVDRRPDNNMVDVEIR